VDNNILDTPSDDPDTPAVNDPTRDIVGNLPLLYAEKRVTLVQDLGSPGIVDPGDVLRYTITIQNSAAIAATDVFLRDSLPANTTYVANSTLLNGSPVGQPDGGTSPLLAGVSVGTIGPGGSATLLFDLRVNAGTPAGTVISNQAIIDSVELPDLLTDGDGNQTTGPEPTLVVVGASQQVSITKGVAVVGGGAAVAGAELEYVVRVLNIASVPALNVVITDNLDAPQPGRLVYVSGSATLNGSPAGVSVAGSTITANYASAIGALEPNGIAVLRFRAILATGLAEGTVVTNTGVVAWNQPTQTASASVSVIVGGVPGFAVMSGSAWHDANFDNARDAGERPLAGWTVGDIAEEIVGERIAAIDEKHILWTQRAPALRYGCCKRGKPSNPSRPIEFDVLAAMISGLRGRVPRCHLEGYVAAVKVVRVQDGYPLHTIVSCLGSGGPGRES
jgi:uncharacterized repeat protein (TIGR01451 family)